MRFFRVFAIASVLVPATLFVACGEDEANVRPAPDGGGPIVEAGDGAVLACGAVVPTTYVSASFAANTAIESALRARYSDIENTMRSTEGTSTATVTAAQLRAFFDQGNPTLRGVSTTNAATLIDTYFTQYELAMSKTWTPADGDGDAGAALTGGKLGNFYFSAKGVDLREAVQKTLLGGAFYNHALAVAAGPPSEATVDRLLAIFGASTSLANRTNPDAGAEEDLFLAEYASKRDDKSQPGGIYRRIKFALLAMKAAAATGEKCRADYDAALAIYFREWERASFATAVFYLNDAATKAVAASPNYSSALHAYGEALGFIQSFKGIEPTKRKITDIEIDGLLGKMGASTPYVLGTNPPQRALDLSATIADIATIQQFNALEVDGFKKSF